MKMENQYQDMMLAKFRQHYPHGSLLSELIKIDRGLYIVKVSLEVDNVILATALAAADQVEVAEDHARTRAISALVLDIQPTTQAQSIPPQDSISEPEDTASNSTETLSSNSKNESASTASNPIGTLSNNSKSQSDSTFTPANTYSPPVEVEQESETATIPNSGNLFEGTGEMVADNSQIDKQDKVAPTSTILNSDNLFDSATAILADEPEIDNQFETFLYEEVTTATPQIETLDIHEIVSKTDIEIKRLGWTRDDGREFLQSHYGKRSRLHLTNEQLLEFLRYLEKLPTPVK
ncbi:hypothetical protein NIES4102_20960 [Chondrocystis sp. NIES-4102]|nr:hypothetical protein NIES4102_20960 [Chondrocystis sp. NIES-4102]